MSLTRLDLRTRIQNLADIKGSPRWDFTPGSTGEVDQHIGIVHSKEWRRILSDQPYYRVAMKTPTSDASGNFKFSDLSISSGDTQQRMYRVLMVAVNNLPYQEVQAKDALLSQTTTGGSYRIWYRNDANIVCPDAPNTTATGIWVNHLPTRADNLSADSATVEFPDDYEDILVYEAAARLLSKGGTQTDTASEFKAMAESDRADMLQDLARFTTKPLIVSFPDFPHDWSSQL